MSEEKNNPNWDVKDNKVRIGNSWKSAQQVQQTFLIESVLFIVVGIFSAWSFTTNVILGLVTLFVALFILSVAIGSYNALQAVGGKIKITFFSSVGAVASKILKSIQQWVRSLSKKMTQLAPTKVEDIVESFTTLLVKTNSDDSQKLIDSIEVDAFFDVSDDYAIKTKQQEIIGYLGSSSIKRLDGFQNNKIKCKVLKVEEGKAGKKAVKVEVIVLKD